MKESNGLTPLPSDRREAGYLVPIIGRTVRRDVTGFRNFPLIRSGEVITAEIAERAQAMGRFYELTEATRVTE